MYKDRERQKAAVRALQTAKREKLYEYKSNTPCVDCGQKYHYAVMDFDHREGETKSYGVGNRSASAFSEKWLQEIAKCDLVCANCHRMRTHKRNSYRNGYL